MEVLRHAVLLLICMPCISGPMRAEIQEQTIVYEHEGASLEGVIYFDDAFAGARPGVLVVHEWWGLNAYAKDRARQLAKLGYTAFAVDMYGKGKVTTHPQQAGECTNMITANVELWQERAVVAAELFFGVVRVAWMERSGIRDRDPLTPASAIHGASSRSSSARHPWRDAFVFV